MKDKNNDYTYDGEYYEDVPQKKKIKNQKLIWVLNKLRYKNIVSIILVIGGVFLAYNGIMGWGWLIFIAWAIADTN